ncbi:diaminopimelate epimerase [Nocardioides daphniae]
MGKPLLGVDSTVTVGERAMAAANVDMGNPHAVTFVDDLAEAGSLLEAPGHDVDVYPHGVNVEFVVRRGEHHVAMRVHERGSGETRSCGTGACAVMVATAVLDGAPRGTEYRVDVPGGTLSITWTDDDRILMTGPAVLVARGETDL